MDIGPEHEAMPRQSAEHLARRAFGAAMAFEVRAMLGEGKALAKN